VSAPASLRDVRWALKRLRRMPAREIVLVRAPRTVRGAASLLRERIVGPRAAAARGEAGERAASLLAGNDLILDRNGADLARRLSSPAIDDLLAEAEDLARGRFRLFGETVEIGGEVDWHRDPLTGARWPEAELSESIDWRPETRPGDPKNVWEILRHQHLVRQALAYRATGDERHAAGVLRAISSYLGATRPGRGVHDASALEMARRAQSWILAFSILGDSAEARKLARAAAHELLRVLFAVLRRLSLYSSANNHLAGELAGVALVALLFEREEKSLRSVRERAVRRLARAAASLVLPDGSGAEQSPAYLAYVVDDLFLVARALARRGEAVPEAIASAARRGRAFLAALDAAFSPGPFPRFGDEDGGFSTGLPPGGPGGLLSTAALEPLSDSSAAPEAPPGGFAVYGDSGLVLFRSEGRPTISFLFDAGPLGFPPLYGHAHSDGLSIALSVGGAPVVVDPGTFAYYRGEKWRSHFRGARSHATLTIGGEDPCRSLGPFLWDGDPGARLLEATARDGRFEARGERRGTSRRPGSPVVTRSVSFERRGRDAIVTVRDEIAGSRGGEFPVAIAFPLDARCGVALDGRRRTAAVSAGSARVEIAGPRSLTMRCARGEDGPHGPLGFQSRGYGRMEPAPVIVFEGGARGPFETVIRIAAPTGPGGD